MTKSNTWQLGHTLILGGVVLLIVLITGGVIDWPLVKGDPTSRVLTWWVIAALQIFSLGIIGHGIVGRPLGFLIDDRNRMSLSRLQLVSWTIVVLSGFYTIVLWNVRNGESNPLNVAIPQELWWVMGISTTSLVASPLIKSIKKNTVNNAPDDFDNNKTALIAHRGAKFIVTATKAATDTAATTGNSIATAPTIPPTTPPATVATPSAPTNETAKDAIVANGQEVYFESPDMASPADLFGGEETGNVHVLDMGKVQMFYFTLILVVTYTMSLLAMLSSTLPSGELSFPPVNEGMVALLGISHAGYLGFKAAPHSPTQDLQPSQN